MPLPTFDTFSAQWRAAGYDEVLERRWAPGQMVDTHTHSFAVQALVVEGELWLTLNGETRHLRPGDSFELKHSEPHAERYGASGAVYWAARRHAA